MMQGLKWKTLFTSVLAVLTVFSVVVVADTMFDELKRAVSSDGIRGFGLGALEDKLSPKDPPKMSGKNYLGITCTEDRQCFSDICVGNICRSGLYRSVCEHHHECISNICFRGMCRTGLALDASPCYNDTFCQSGNVCVNQTCRAGEIVPQPPPTQPPQVPEGEEPPPPPPPTAEYPPCDKWCQENNIMNVCEPDGLCKKLHWLPPKAPCTDNKQCITGVCVSGWCSAAVAGSNCTSSKQCLSAICHFSKRKRQVPLSELIEDMASHGEWDIGGSSTALAQIAEQIRGLPPDGILPGPSSGRRNRNPFKLGGGIKNAVNKAKGFIQGIKDKVKGFKNKIKDKVNGLKNKLKNGMVRNLGRCSRGLDADKCSRNNQCQNYLCIGGKCLDNPLRIQRADDPNSQIRVVPGNIAQGNVIEK